MKNRRSRILAMMLSFVMLTGEALPVFAEGEVSADEVVIEETVEEDEAEEAEETEETGEEAEADEAEEAVEAGEEAPAAEEEEAVAEEVVVTVGPEETAEEEAESGQFAYGLMYVTMDEDGVVRVAADDIDPVGAAYSSFITTGTRKNYTIQAGTIVIDDVTYELNAVVSYAGSISYRGRKIKPIEDLGMTASCTGINNLIKRLSPSANPSTILKWKATAKKNKNVNDPAYFNVKVSVDSKAAKAAGISGKNLKKLKKAVSALNKVSKKKESRISFSITQLNALNMWNNDVLTFTYKYERFTGHVLSISAFYGRLDKDMPESINMKTRNKWAKISKNEFTITKTKNGSKYDWRFEPKNKNFYGSSIVVTLK